MRRVHLIAAGLLASPACSANDDFPRPQVASVQPDHASPGMFVDVHGDHFCQRPGDNEDPLCDPVGAVHFGASPGTTILWTETLIQAEVPTGMAGHVDLTVIASGRVSNAIGFTID
jgi:hypothetical protein